MKEKAKRFLQKLQSFFQKRERLLAFLFFVFAFFFLLQFFLGSPKKETNQKEKSFFGQGNTNQNSFVERKNNPPSFVWENHSSSPSVSDLGTDLEDKSDKKEEEKPLPPENLEEKAEWKGQSQVETALPPLGGTTQENLNDPNREKQVLEYMQKSPGKMDGYLRDIQKAYVKDPKYPLINDYLVVLKDVFDGKRAWTGAYQGKSWEFFGEKKAKEIAQKVKEANQNKEERIKEANFANIDSLSSAIRQDTKNYLEKAAIEGFLNHMKEIADYKYPLSEAYITQGEFFLEQAWINQVYKVLASGRKERSAAFLARKFNTIEELEEAIKKDTENYKEKFLRDQWLSIMKEAYRNHLDPNIMDGAELAFESYHIEAIKKFLRENRR